MDCDRGFPVVFLVTVHGLDQSEAGLLSVLLHGLDTWSLAGDINGGRYPI